jgi:hypothetical protein
MMGPAGSHCAQKVPSPQNKPALQHVPTQNGPACSRRIMDPTLQVRMGKCAFWANRLVRAPILGAARRRAQASCHRPHPPYHRHHRLRHLLLLHQHHLLTAFAETASVWWTRLPHCRARYAKLRGLAFEETSVYEPRHPKSQRHPQVLLHRHRLLLRHRHHHQHRMWAHVHWLRIHLRLLLQTMVHNHQLRSAGRAAVTTTTCPTAPAFNSQCSPWHIQQRSAVPSTSAAAGRPRSPRTPRMRRM